MSYLVYLSCALTSLGCTALLFRSARTVRSGLVIWCALCFLGLTFANILLFIDVIMVPNVDLSLWRTGITLLGASLLLFGLIRSSA
jgi:hypothetical protein